MMVELLTALAGRAAADLQLVHVCLLTSPGDTAGQPAEDDITDITHPTQANYCYQGSETSEAVRKQLKSYRELCKRYDLEPKGVFWTDCPGPRCLTNCVEASAEETWAGCLIRFHFQHCTVPTVFKT